MSKKCELFKPQDSIEFVRQLTNLAERLVIKDFVIASLEIDYCFFGSWRLEVRKNDEAIQFSYDDRDRDLLIEKSPDQELLSAPNEWRQVHVQSFDQRQKVDPLRFVEDYLTKQTSS